jgi:hypothetical protein
MLEITLLMFCDNELDIKPEYLTFDKIKVETIRDFLHWLEKVRNVSINTVVSNFI